jgi:2-methylcitrate dehydratase PrpD
MDAMRALVLEHDIRPDQIRAIRLRAGSNILKPLRYSIAHSELEAKFCPAFMLSSIAIRRKAGIHEFTDEFVRSAPVQDMMSRVQTILDPAIEARGFEKIRSIVEIELEDGRQLIREADERYRGGPDRPFTRDELQERFEECAALVLSPAAIAETFAMLESLDHVADIRDLLRVATNASAESAQPA